MPSVDRQITKRCRVGSQFVCYRCSLAARPREAARFLSTLAAREAFLPKIRQERVMDDDHRELARRRLAAMVEMTETTHGTAIAGRSEARTAYTKSR